MMLLAILAFAQGNLSSNQRVIGYTVTDDVDVQGAVFGTPGTYTIGARLDPTVLAAYKGCRVVGVRLHASVDLGRTRIFLNNINGSKMTEVHSQNQRLYQGWNEVFFNGDGYEISGDETFFYGFDYVETKAMNDSERGGISCVGQDTDGAFVIYMNNTMQSASGVGKLCIQLIVDVTNLAADNMTLGMVDTGFKYKKTDENLELFAVINNVGRDAIKSYRMAYRIDDMPEQYVDVSNVNIASGAQSAWQHVISRPEGVGVGIHTVTLWVDRVNSTTLPYSDDTDFKASFAYYEKSMQRNGTYMEVYTDQNSYLASLFNPSVDAVDALEGVYAVNIHAPGSPLAAEGSDYLFDVYAYTRPSFTTNRSRFPGETHVAFDLNDYLGMLDGSLVTGILRDLLAQDATSPSFAGLNLTCGYDEATRRLTVSAKGETLPEAEAIYGDLALTLMLVEDGVVDGQVVVSGNSAVLNRKYTHNNVLRAYMTSPYGAPLTVAGNAFTASHTFTLPEGWNPSRMRVVGLLTKALDRVTAANTADADVINVAEAALTSAAGITDVAVSPEAAAVEGYYTLQGVRVDADNLPAGVYIRRYVDGRADKILVK